MDTLRPKQREQFSNFAKTDGVSMNLVLDVSTRLSGDYSERITDAEANDESSNESVYEEEFDRFVVDEKCCLAAGNSMRSAKSTERCSRHQVFVLRA